MSNERCLAHSGGLHRWCVDGSEFGPLRRCLACGAAERIKRQQQTQDPVFDQVHNYNGEKDESK